MAGLYPQRGQRLSTRNQIDSSVRYPPVSHNFARQHRLAHRLGCRRGNRRADYWDFIWLVYSVFFFIDPVSRHNPHVWVNFAFFYALFLALYSSVVIARSRWQAYFGLAALTAIGAAYLPHNGGAWGCFVYVAAFLPFIFDSSAIALGGIALLGLIMVVEGILLHITPWAWGFGALITFMVGGTNLFTAQKIRANSKLQLAQDEIEQLAKVAERERIARDLHDVLGHTLSVIVLKSELAGRLLSSNPDRASAEITQVESIARKALSEVREAITGYRAEGLPAEIQRARNVLDSAGVTLLCEENPPALSPGEETVLALALREAVTNVVRHAQATRCEMRFVTRDGKTTLVVEDNGRGGLRQEGNGLRGMRERIEALGGRFAIDSAQGTRLTIELPLKQLPASS